jgi:hypothetical protein
MQISQYIVIEESTISSIQYSVTNYLKMGFVPLGPMIPYEDAGSLRFTQTMVLYEQTN